MSGIASSRRKKNGLSGVLVFLWLLIGACGQRPGDDALTVDGATVDGATVDGATVDAGPDIQSDDDHDGYNEIQGDCDDSNPDVHPGAVEVCGNRMDDDCDGFTDDQQPDADGDGYGPCLGDCDDGDPNVHPHAEEIAGNGKDDNCDGVVDGDFDTDGYTEANGDCNDHDPLVNPSMAENCYDGIDNDCNGATDSEEPDQDGDGYGPCGGDCDDTNPNVHPGAPEIAGDGIDNNCDFLVDEDIDGDGWTETNGDCDDSDPDVHPGAIEACDNSIDDDCDGITDTDCGDICETPSTLAGSEAQLATHFSSLYSTYRLGAIPGVTTTHLGGMTISSWDNDILLVAVNSEEAGGQIYEVGVQRGPCGHLLAFQDATPLATTPYVDANLVYGPAQDLFYTEWPVQKVGQLLPGHTTPDRETDVSALASGCGGADQGPGGIGFVPPNLTAAGQMRLSTWSGGCWYHMDYQADGSLFTLSNPVQVAASRLQGGPGGFAYVPAGSPGFASQSLIVAEWSANKVAVYLVDQNGDPTTTTRQDFFTTFPKPWGAYFDKVSGDFLFLTWGGEYAGQVYVVQGFVPPPPPPN
ncbi:MAG: hypothetical protein J7M25_10760 [Deltaproteobacteria bacterium]|nr:hypothetical protein [Deltaproteobacteria bacterium]